MGLQGSALVNQPDGLGATPLHYAATGASNHLTQLLITKVYTCTHTNMIRGSLTSFNSHNFSTVDPMF